MVLVDEPGVAESVSHTRFTFPDYDIASLVEIARRTAAARQYRLSPQAEQKLRRQLQAIYRDPLARQNFSNARWVRNAIERAIRMHAARLFDAVNVSRDALMTLDAIDFVEETEA